MSIDPVAVYAAVVATFAVGVQIYQWRSDKAGKLDDRKGNLDVEVHPFWLGHDDQVVVATFINTNDYPVRIEFVMVSSYKPGSDEPPSGRPENIMAEQAGLDSEIPAHDNMRRTWKSGEPVLAGTKLSPGYEFVVMVVNTLGHVSMGTGIVKPMLRSDTS